LSRRSGAHTAALATRAAAWTEPAPAIPAVSAAACRSHPSSSRRSRLSGS
jgi:hypothetical protein